MSIQSFGDQITEDFFYDGDLPSKGCGWKQLQSKVARKLDMIDAADALTDLRQPPGNRLKKLKGDLDDYHSIRINDPWRVIFRWSNDGPEQVEVVDYH